MGIQKENSETTITISITQSVYKRVMKLKATMIFENFENLKNRKRISLSDVIEKLLYDTGN